MTATIAEPWVEEVELGWGATADIQGWTCLTCREVVDVRAPRTEAAKAARRHNETRHPRRLAALDRAAQAAAAEHDTAPSLRRHGERCRTCGHPHHSGIRCGQLVPGASRFDLVPCRCDA